MPIFYFHPQNEIPKKLIEMTGCRGFNCVNRGELEFKLQNLFSQLDIDLWPTFHTVVGALGKKVTEFITLDPDDELDRHTLKVLKSSATPWSYLKIMNGPQMNFVLGYTSIPASSPFALTAAQMAQKGIIGVSHVPSVIQ